jgi:hypothetical protein
MKKTVIAGLAIALGTLAFAGCAGQGQGQEEADARPDSGFLAIDSATTDVARPDLGASEAPISDGSLMDGSLLDAGSVADATNSPWSVVASPNPGGPTGQSDLSSVSCGSTTSCFAVGWYNTGVSGSFEQPLIERWDGTAWSIVTEPTLPAGNAELYSVFCTSPSSCVAVGDQQPGGTGTYATLAESWNGSSWSVVGGPALSTSVDSHLRSVACASATACTAVGEYDLDPLAEWWDGTTWSVVGSAPPRAAGNGCYESGFYGVSCASASDCMAVGQVGSQVASFAERWDGTQFSEVPFSSCSDAATAIACASDGTCKAVGDFFDPSGFHPNIWSWDGAFWTSHLFPNAASTSAVLTGVACSAPGNCMAVGGNAAASSQSERSLSASWDGSMWSVIPSPPPPNDAATLNSVTCPAAGFCVAVGSINSEPFIESLGP